MTALTASASVRRNLRMTPSVVSRLAWSMGRLRAQCSRACFAAQPGALTLGAAANHSVADGWPRSRRARCGHGGNLRRPRPLVLHDRRARASSGSHHRHELEHRRRRGDRAPARRRGRGPRGRGWKDVYLLQEVLTEDRAAALVAGIASAGGGPYHLAYDAGQRVAVLSRAPLGRLQTFVAPSSRAAPRSVPRADGRGRPGRHSRRHPPRSDRQAAGRSRPGEPRTLARDRRRAPRDVPQVAAERVGRGDPAVARRPGRRDRDPGRRLQHRPVFRGHPPDERALRRHRGGFRPPAFGNLLARAAAVCGRAWISSSSRRESPSSTRARSSARPATITP